VLDQRTDRAAAGSDRVAVAEALDAVFVAQPDRDQLEMRDLAVGRIRQDHRKLDAEEAGVDRAERHAEHFPDFGPAARVVDPGRSLP
jgi:hypothetical protein